MGLKVIAARSTGFCFFDFSLFNSSFNPYFSKEAEVYGKSNNTVRHAELVFVVKETCRHFVTYTFVIQAICIID